MITPNTAPRTRQICNKGQLWSFCRWWLPTQLQGPDRSVTCPKMHSEICDFLHIQILFSTRLLLNLTDLPHTPCCYLALSNYMKYKSRQTQNKMAVFSVTWDARVFDRMTPVTSCGSLACLSRDVGQWIRDYNISTYHEEDDNSWREDAHVFAPFRHVWLQHLWQKTKSSINIYIYIHTYIQGYIS